MHEAFNARDFDAFGEVFAQDVEMVVDGAHFLGLAAVAGYAQSVVREFPGVRMHLDRIVVEAGDTIVTETHMVNSAEGASGDASGGDWRLQGTVCDLYRIARGRIVDCRTYLAIDGSATTADGETTPPRADFARMAAEQAALRRVATLVARGSPEAEVFDAVVTETYQLLGEDFTALLRYEPDGGATSVALHGARDEFAVGHITPAEGDGVAQRVLRSGAPARVDSYRAAAGAGPAGAHRQGISAGAGAPIVVQARLWGVLMVVTRGETLAAGIETRLAQFAELAATAIANAQSRSELQLLADEQTALRRVAELVARGVAPEAVFDAVAIEASGLLSDDATALLRFNADGDAVIVAVCGGSASVGMRVPTDRETATGRVWRTGRAVRIDDYRGVPGGELSKELGLASSVCAPIVVDGRLWGLISANTRSGALPPTTEGRLAQFAELVGAAIANAESHAELTASRARIVASADAARRRLQRDVHDGAQQRLVHAVITLKLAQASLGDSAGRTAELVDESLWHAEQANAQLRELARGLLPAALTRGGLSAGIDSLVAHIDLPVRVDVLAERLPAAVETTAYFIVAEGLTNVVKHACAASAHVGAHARDGRLHLEVRDDGSGGAQPGRGTGLVGLADRIDAVGGTLSITSPAGGGTILSASLSIDPEPGERPAPI